MVSDQESIFGMTAVLCATGIYLAIVLARAELRRFRTPSEAEKPYSNTGRFARRLLGSTLVGALMVMILLGVYAIDFSHQPMLAVLYWGGFCLLVLLLTLVGVIDLLDTRRIAHLENSRAMKRLIEEIEARRAQD